MAGAGLIIIFVSLLAGFAIWSTLTLLLTAHYFLVTLIDTSTGIDEIHYPTEPLLDRWWKPLLCLWLAAFWILAGSILLAPLLLGQQRLLLLGLAALVWITYPISVLSVLTTRWWIHVVDVALVWRLFRQAGPLAYVYIVTLLLAACSIGLVVGVYGQSFLWAMPASIVLPAALLLYARHWGRLVWLAHDETPKKKRRRSPRRVDEMPEAEKAVSVAAVAEIAPPAAICAGMPPNPAQAYQAAAPDVMRALAMSADSNVEEDEWSRNKKPYSVEETQPAAQDAATAFVIEKKSHLDKPIALAEYYDQRMDQEEIRKEKEAVILPFLTPNSKVPTFESALVRGVWEFMIYPRTLQVWINLAVLTIVELVFVFLVVRFWPNV